MSPNPELELVKSAERPAHKDAADGIAAISANSIEALLSLEAQARTIGSEQEFHYFAANETRKLIPYRQAVVVVRKPQRGYRIAAVSSLALVDNASPFTVWIEGLFRRFADDARLDELQEFSLRAYSDPDAPQHEEYPFAEAVWLPFRNEGEGVFAGMLLLRERPWEQQQTVIGRRVAETYAHAWSALRRTPHRSLIGRYLPRKMALGLAALLAAAMFLPVSLTTLAPVEVVASDPQINAAPIRGVIEEIVVDPNAFVREGELLYRFDDTDLRNRFRIAEQDVEVAAARLRRARQSAFSQADAAHEIAILEAELNRSRLELAYAGEQLAMVEVRAAQGGIVLYSDRKDWVGKPVVIGEKVLRVADPEQVEFSIDVPVKDAIVLEDGARVRIYLDADPVSPIDARLITASYHARELPGQTLAYRARAQLSSGDDADLRVGLRGTAKIYGERVSLFFYLFRRPISYLRQFFGI